MNRKRFVFEQNGNFHTVIDTVENKPIGVFEFKEDEFSAYACFHMIIDKMNELYEENKWLFKCIENQSALINELDNTIMAYNMEHKITIKLTEKDLKTLDKALSYYTHQKVGE